jgi:hypothetical protein
VEHEPEPIQRSTEVKPTWSKTYKSPGTGTSKVFGRCNVAVITSTKGTQFADDSGVDPKLLNTCDSKLRYEILKKHGKAALARTYKHGRALPPRRRKK